MGCGGTIDKLDMHCPYMDECTVIIVVVGLSGAAGSTVRVFDLSSCSLVELKRHCVWSLLFMCSLCLSLQML
jgi:hypothetical protein